MFQKMYVSRKNVIYHWISKPNTVDSRLSEIGLSKNPHYGKRLLKIILRIIRNTHLKSLWLSEIKYIHVKLHIWKTKLRTTDKVLLIKLEKSRL